MKTALPRLGPRTLTYAVIGTLVLALMGRGFGAEDTFNPDAIAYIRSAFYYTAGELDLAVSGYWSPLLSWMIAGLLPLTPDPIRAAHTAIGLSGIVFFVGAAAALKSLRIPPPFFGLGIGILLPYTVVYSFVAITPDFLMAGLLSLAIAAMLSPRWLNDGRWQLGAGGLLGLAYLAKAVALPLGMALVCVLPVVMRRIESETAQRTARAAAITLLGLAALAVPWIVTLSVKYGEVTFSTSGTANHALIGPGDPSERYHPTFHSLHVPEVGRLTSWEDPSVLAYRTWSPAASAANARHQLKTSAMNALAILLELKRFDYLALGLIAAGAAIFVRTAEPWRYAGLIAAIASAIYLPIVAGVWRYYVPAYPFVLGACLGVAAWITPRLEKSWRHAPRLVLAAVALSYGLAIASAANLHIGRQNAEFRTAQDMAELIRSRGVDGDIASVADIDSPGTFRTALYVAFLTERRYLGNETSGASPLQLRASGARFILADEGHATVAALARSQQAWRLARFDGAEGANAIQVFQMGPPGGS